MQETVKQLVHLIARRIRESTATGRGADPATQSRDFLDNFKELPNENALLSAFELRLPYSNDTEIDVEHTIEQAGLTPSAVVVFRRRERCPPRGG